MRLTFLGGVGTVTGSKYLLRTRGGRLLVDCGLFQGLKALREKNWEPMPLSPQTIDAVALTHAHIDHSGYLPLLVKNGYHGPIYCTAATRDLCEVLLPDCGYLQEEEAEFANRHGYSKHAPARPLYTQKDAVRSLERLRVVDYDREIPIAGGMSLLFRPTGHILGASMIRVTGEGKSILFSGDLGRHADPIMRPPASPPEADTVVVESTYGDRRHGMDNPLDELEEVVNRTTDRNGAVIIPAFAVGRAQTILYMIHRLKVTGRLPDIPVYLNSPMAIDATEIFFHHHSEHRLSREECRVMYDGVRLVRTAEESIRLNQRRGPMIIISASGMATGGRILHHIEMFGPEPQNTILFAGYQAVGTRGADMVAGQRSIKIHGRYVPIHAEVALLENLSAHADYEEILGWLGALPYPPITTYVTHGEPRAADALRRRIVERFGWSCRVPDFRETVVLHGRG